MSGDTHALNEIPDHQIRDHDIYVYRLANALHELGRLDEALPHYHKAIDIKPDYAEAYNNLGNVLKKLGRLEEAVTCYHKALAIKPDYAVAHCNLGTVFQELGQLDEAIASYHKSLTIKPDYAEAHYNLGATLTELERLEEALVQLERVVQLDPSFVDVWMARAVTLIQLDRFRDARDALTQATAIHADDPGLTDLLVRVLTAAPDDSVRDGALALALMQERFKGPVSLEMYETMAMALAEVGQYDEAATWQRQAMSAAEQNGLGDVARNMANALALYEQGQPVRGLFGIPTP